MSYCWTTARAEGTSGFSETNSDARRVLSETIQTFQHLLQRCGLHLLILCALTRSHLVPAGVAPLPRRV